MTFFAALFSPTIGRWIDRSPSRLRTISRIIWLRRLSIVLAYALWIFLVDDSNLKSETSRAPQSQGTDTVHADAATEKDQHSNSNIKAVLFAAVLAIGVVVRLSSIANDISIKTEWLPVLAPSLNTPQSRVSNRSYSLTQLNATLKQIDLACKLLSPALLTASISIVKTYRMWIMLIGILTIMLGVTELWCARWIFRSNPALKASKYHTDSDGSSSLRGAVTDQPSKSIALWSTCRDSVFAQANTLLQYLSSSVCIPATAMALLHLTVLAYSASLITYLLEIGFPLITVTSARTSGTLVEIGIALSLPHAVRWFSEKHVKQTAKEGNLETEDEAEGFLDQDEPRRESGKNPALDFVGLLGILWQFCNLVSYPAHLASSQWSEVHPKPESYCLKVPVVIALSQLSTRTGSSSTKAYAGTATSICLFLFLSLSRAGIVTYELTTQEIIQTTVPQTYISSFAGTQKSLQSLCELAHWVATAAWGERDEFRWLAVGSLGAVATAAFSHAMWVLKRWRENDLGMRSESRLQALYAT